MRCTPAQLTSSLNLVAARRRCAPQSSDAAAAAAAAAPAAAATTAGGLTAARRHSLRAPACAYEARRSVPPSADLRRMPAAASDGWERSRAWALLEDLHAAARAVGSRDEWSGKPGKPVPRCPLRRFHVRLLRPRTVPSVRQVRVWHRLAVLQRRDWNLYPGGVHGRRPRPAHGCHRAGGVRARPCRFSSPSATRSNPECCRVVGCLRALRSSHWRLDSRRSRLRPRLQHVRRPWRRGLPPPVLPQGHRQGGAILH